MTLYFLALREGPVSARACAVTWSCRSHESGMRGRVFSGRVSFPRLPLRGPLFLQARPPRCACAPLPLELVSHPSFPALGGREGGGEWRAGRRERAAAAARASERARSCRRRRARGVGGARQVSEGVRALL